MLDLQDDPGQDPQDPPAGDAPAAGGGRLYSAEEFGSVIRRLYPTLGGATADNKKLTSAILKVHPEFRDHVIDPAGGMDDAAQVLGYNPGTTKLVPRQYGTGLPAAPPGPLSAQDAGEADQTPVARRASAKGGPGTVQTTAGDLRAGARRQDESYAGQVFASPVTGAVRAAKGAEPLLQAARGSFVRSLAAGTRHEQRINDKYPPVPGEELAQGGADVIGGAMEGATALLPEAAAAAPLGVGAGLLAGGAAAAGVEKAGTALGAPPGFVHLASELTGLVAGLGGGHLAERVHANRVEARKAPLYEQMGTEAGNAIADAERNRAFDEAGMRGDFAAHNEQLSDDLSLDRTLRFKNQQIQDQEIDKLSLGLAENYRLSQIAKRLKAGEAAAHGSPFEALDAFGEQPPAALQLPPGPEPAGLLGPGSPAAILAQGSDQVFPGPEAMDPNVVDVVDPSLADQRPVATSEVPPPPLVQTLGEQLSSELQNQPPSALQPRLAPGTKAKLSDRLEFRDRVRQMAADAVSEMEYMTHDRGGYFGDVTTGDSYFTPPVAGSDWYWRVVGRGADNPPSRAYITEMMRAYKDSKGALTGAELSPEVVEAGQKGGNYKTEGGFRRAYDRWAPEVDKAIQGRVGAEMSYIRRGRMILEEDARRAREAAGGDGSAAAEGSQGTVEEGSQPGTRFTEYSGEPPTGEGDQVVPAEPSVTEPGEPPSPVETTGEAPQYYTAAEAANIRESTGEIIPPEQILPEGPPALPEPDRPIEHFGAPRPEPLAPERPEGMRLASGNRPEPEGGERLPDRSLSPGQQEGIDSLDFLQSAIHGEDYDPVGNGTLTEDEQFKADAQDVADSADTFSSLSDFFEHMKGEEGHLILNVGPNSKRGLKAWLDRHADEYGEEEWHQKASAALDAGDVQVAWRIAAMASARSMAATGARGAVDREHQPVTMSPNEIKDFHDSPRYTRAVDALKNELGVKKLPAGIDINEDGQMTFGPPEKNLKAAATDLLLGRNFAGNVIDAADPRKIIRIAGNRDSELRINRQIAEQLVRSMPDEIVDPLIELLKLDDRAEFAKHFARTVSSWGKGLRMLKDWQDENWNDIVHIANPRPEGIGMGAAHLDEIRTTGGFVDWLKDASAEDREDVGFGYPKNIKEGTEEATKFAKSWFKAREARAARRITLAKTIGELAEDGSTLDKALIAGALEPVGTKSRGTLDAVENTSRAFVISQPVTLIRNMWTQAARYSVGVLDDALAAGYSMLAMDPKGAQKFADRALATAKAVGAEGNASTKMLKTPWLDSLETTYDYMADSVNGLPAEDVRKTIRLLDEFPRRAATYSGGLALENGGPTARQTSKIPGVTTLIQPEVRNFVTVLGRTQEMAFRGAVFDSAVRSALTAEGLDPAIELAGDPTKLIAKLGEKKMDQIIGGAVASALDYTFAAKPYPGSIPSLLLNTFSNIPVFSAMLRMGMPFPRFNFVSAPRWIYDHSPAALLDIPMGIIGQFTSEGAPLKGRLFRGLEAQKIQDKVIPHLASEIGKTEYTIADKTQEFVRLKVEAQQAAKSFKELEKRAAKTGILPEIHDAIMAAGQEMQAKVAAAQQAKQAHGEAVTQLRELKKQQKGVEEKLLKIKEIGAPTTAEYFSRQTTGAAMLTAAYLMRSSDGAKDTKWYEYNVEAPGFGKHTLDLRSFAPMVQFLLPADVMHSIHEDTDWPKVHEYLGKHPLDWEGAMSKFYHGKYTGGTAAAEAATAFLSISPASGATATIIDYMTGRSGTVKQGFVQAGISAVLSTVGQFIGRFTTPIRPLKDIAGQFDPEEAKARIPQESSDQSHHMEELYGPALGNVPYASELIKEKKSPLTGDAIATVNPMARALAGLSEHDKNRIEVEIAHTGIEYSKLVPRQTGDREFDNAVAEAYHKGLVKYAPKLLDHPKYQGMNPELRRDILGSAFGGLKQYALMEAGKALGLEGKATHEKVESPAAKQKLDRWRGYLQEMRAETERDHPTPVEDGGPQARAGESNAPPSGVADIGGVGFQPQPFGQHVDRGLEQGRDARPPAGL